MMNDDDNNSNRCSDVINTDDDSGIAKVPVIMQRFLRIIENLI